MPNAKLLLLETSGRVGQVGLAEGTVLRAERRLDATRRHARDLAPAVRELLAEVGWRPRDIEAVIVSRGPGSYTGLRVGIMSAKAFAYATGCRLLAIDTFALLALQAGPGLDVEVIADAQQERIYAQRFRFENELTPIPVNELHVLPLADWLSTLTKPCRVTGPALGLHRQRLPQTCAILPDADWEPRLPSLVHLANGRLARNESDNVFQVEPLYVRPSSAEEKWVQMGR